jgi:vesicle coat complex subunit
MESIYTLINCEDEGSSKTESELKKELENGKDNAKIIAMKNVLTQMLKGKRKRNWLDSN